ncbi:CDKN2A-interacting protein isoform X2 [Pantherophis guttatus]|uniref:CDKN2A-interacting protein isoform X2 n=1 Tax=Pantherophis guttatus TaxID=94885 RepID=A0A6P9AGF2_PANGU|nr:CDKN2A-interacting protein isoform X2 [Pantherophis guttatus]
MAEGEAAPVAGPAAASSQGNEKAGEASDAGVDWVEKLRDECEPEQHWQYRREFLIRNAEGLSVSRKDDADRAELRRLVSFSRVWANHVFLGCRYSPQVMEKVMDMAVGITVTNAPTHTLRDELVAKVKRGISSSNGPCKKQAVGADKPFEVNNEKSTKAELKVETDKESLKNVEKDISETPEKTQSSPTAALALTQKVEPTTASTVSQKTKSASASKLTPNVVPAAASTVTQKIAPAAPLTGGRIESKAANYESTPANKHKSENVLQAEKKVGLESTTVLASKSSSHTSVAPVKVPCKLLTHEDAKERQPFFNRLYKAVAWKLVAAGGFSPSVNHVELLNSSIQSVKATLDVEFVPLKELADLPQNKSSQESIVCELRCKSVYLGTGCGKSKENAKAVASREALKLFLKKKVIVKLCKRKYKGREIEDLVLLDEESKPLNLPPALRNPQEILHNSESVTAYTSK